MFWPSIVIAMSVFAAILLWMRAADLRAEREPTDDEAAAVRQAAERVLGPMREILRRTEEERDE